MSDTEYRYVAARGVEFRDEGFMSWARVPDTILAEMTAAELRKVADAMDGGDVERISAELSGGVWEAEAKQFKLELDEARAQLAALTTPDATPLGWVNVRNGEVSRMWPTKQAALTNMKAEHDRAAVPVYEHPPVAGVRVTDAEIISALDAEFNVKHYGLRAEKIVRALRPLFDRAALPVAPATPTNAADAMQDAPRVATDEEAAAIARVRLDYESAQSRVGACSLFYITDIGHALSALDRVTAERDGCKTAHAYMCDEVKKSDTRIRDLEAQLAAKDEEAAELRFKVAVRDADCARLRAEIARLTATEDTPLGWVNEYENDGNTTYGILHTSKRAAEMDAGQTAVRIAVLVYERPPRATARLTEDEIALAFDRAWHDRTGTPLRTVLVRELLTLLNRHTPPAQVVGACVVWDGERVGYMVAAGNLTTQAETEAQTVLFAKRNGGTAHHLVLGAQIGEGK